MTVNIIRLGRLQGTTYALKLYETLGEYTLEEV